LLAKAGCHTESAIHFESYAIFEANNEGVIDWETTAPIEGTYSYFDGMGLFYSQEFRKYASYNYLDEELRAGKGRMAGDSRHIEGRRACFIGSKSFS